MQITYLEAVIQAQMEEMERDERVILMGEDITVYGGGRIVDRFDASRVWSTPISEGSFAGVGIGAAIGGLRPIVDLGQGRPKLWLWPEVGRWGREQAARGRTCPRRRATR